MEEFLLWFESNPECYCNKIVAKEIEGCGFGLVAIEQIRPSDVIIKVPIQILITPLSVLSTPLKPCIARQPGLITPSESICLFLLHELSKGATSFFAPYLNILPTAFSTPISFYECFPFETLPEKCQQLFSKQISEFERSYDKLLKFYETEIQMIPEYENFIFNKLLFLWAWNCVNTRCIYCEGPQSPLFDTRNESEFLAMAPFVDMLNHCPSAKIEARFCKITKCFEVRSGSTHMSGDQLFLCYGSHSNQRLLLEYGFVLDENVGNSLRLDLSDLRRLCALAEVPLSEKHVEILESCKFTCCIYATDEEPNWNLLATFKLISLASSEIDRRVMYEYDEKLYVDVPALSVAFKVLTAYVNEIKNHRPVAPTDSVGEDMWRMIDRLWQDDVDLVQNCLEQIKEALLNAQCANLDLDSIVQ